MNPNDQECFSLYLYGAGFKARDDNTLGMLTGNPSPPHFCLSCIRREECEDAHEQRVRELLPERAERFDQKMKEAINRGLGATLAAVLLGQRGLDPFAEVAVDNFKRGHGDRGKQSGTLVQ